MNAITLTVPGAPRTKKNSGRRVYARGVAWQMPSQSWTDWRDFALPHLRQWVARTKHKPIEVAVNCAALFYRDADRGDADNFYVGLGDLLQAAGIVKKDRLIVSWDGSRLLKDASNPRTEVTLTLAEINTCPEYDTAAKPSRRRTQKSAPSRRQMSRNLTAPAQQT